MKHLQKCIVIAQYVMAAYKPLETSRGMARTDLITWHPPHSSSFADGSMSKPAVHRILCTKYQACMKFGYS